MNVNLVFGFLGSGKTTLIQRYLGSQSDLSKTAVIVNEFGDVGIDGRIIEGKNIDIIELNSGCLCCNLKGPMLDAIEEIESTKQIETLLIESSGLAEPIDTLEALTDPKLIAKIEVGPIITVISLPHFEKLLDYLGDFYSDQIRNADTLVLNKADLVDAVQSEVIRRSVRELNAKADLLITQQCDLELNKILQIGRRSTDDFVTHVSGLQRSSSIGEHAHVHMDSVIVENANNIRKQDLDRWLNGISSNILRVKGFVNLDGQYSLLQYSVDQFTIDAIELSGSCQMVFIGKHLDRETLTSQYQSLGSKRD